MLEESVVYQDILQKGERRGEQRGLVKGERKLVVLLLEERFGKLSLQVRKQIERLTAAQLEELGKALLHFKGPAGLSAWLKQNA